MKHLQIQLRKMARGDPNYPPPCQPLWLKEIHVTLLPAIFESMGAKLAQLSKLAPKKNENAKLLNQFPSLPSSRRP